MATPCLSFSVLYVPNAPTSINTLFFPKPYPIPSLLFTPLPQDVPHYSPQFLKGNEITEEVTEKAEANVNGKKKIFVAGATGSTDKAKTAFSKDYPALQIVKADVTEGSAKLAEAIGDDSEAVICATGFQPGWDLFAPWKVDNFGTVNLVEACRKLGVNRFILISSILVNGAAMAKLQAEQYIRKSGINYTIIRPGGLRNEPPVGNLVMEAEDTLSAGTISRDQVAEVAVEALLHPEASYKVVEIVASADASKRSYRDLLIP
ncbi:hypothetical protein FNV43_RR05992 [Rhamnella rubrinervis]|uniref:NAD(P)-binding domain-containing protein n=1 Tax=Rhamnella rubrinervis TaxID=2594499 RepID=A0A8K0HD37_9ROSA|nr:hypothetical protein FNV43_RR05992 [Rhamnella rubrinervis]